MTAPDWTTASPDVASFVFEQADKYLSAQLTAGLAADQRATSAAATFSGFGAAILAATFAYYATEAKLPVLLTGITIGIAFVLAAGCSFYSARPVDFSYHGNNPESWYRCLSSPLTESIGIEAENYAEAINENDAILSANAKWLTFGFGAAAIAPAAGAAVFLVTSLFCRV